MASRKRRRKSSSQKNAQKSRKPSKKQKNQFSKNESLNYDSLEPRQLLASADLSGNNFTLEGDSNGNQVFLRVDSGQLQWSEDGVNFTSDLDSTDPNDQTYNLDISNPLNLTINMNNGLNEAFLDLQGEAGLGNVEITDGEMVDAVTIQSDLDLLPTSGSLNINVESVTVSNGTQIAAPSGITIDATLQGQVTIEDNATLSTRNIAPGGNHQTDPSVGNSSNISISGETITIGDNTHILAQADGYASGNININAESALPLIVDLAAIDLSTAANILDFITPESEAIVDIGAAEIRGANVDISAQVTAEANIPDASAILQEIINDGGPISAILTTADYLSDEIDEFLTETTSIPVVYIKETTSATVDVGENAFIVASGNVNISATTRSAESSIVETEDQSLAVTKVDSTSEINVHTGAVISALNDITITTDTAIVSNTRATTHKNLEEADGEKTAIAVAISKSDLVSHVTIDANTLLRAGERINIEALGSNTTTSHAEGGVYGDGGVGATIALNFPKSSVRADVDGNLRAEVNNANTTSGGIVILVDLTANEDAQAVSGLGGTAPEGVEIETVSQIDEIIDKWIKPLIQHIQGLNIVNLTNINLNVASALAFNKTSNEAVAETGPNAVLQSNLDVNVDSQLSDSSRTFAEAIDRLPENSSPDNHLTVALVVGLYDNNSQAILGDGSTVDARRNVAVNADTEYPVQPTVVESNETGFYEVKGNSWARSQSENARSDYAGALNYQEHHNNTEARIGDGAQINQNPVYFTPNQSVFVNSTAEIILLDIAGLFELDIDADALQTIGTTVGQAVFNGGDLDLSLDNLLDSLKEGFQQALNDSEIAFGTTASETAIGGALTFTNMFDNTSATIGENAKVNTGQSGQLTVQATSDIKHYTFAGSGFKAGKTGIEGNLAHNHHKSDTQANIGSGAEINAGLSITVSANSNLEKYGFAGGIFFGGNRGFGVSVATNDVERNTLAFIGAYNSTLGNDVNIVAAGRLNVYANSRGNTIALALSGTRIGHTSITTQSPTNSASNSAEVTDNFANKGTQGSYGLGVSADIAINRSTANNTYAFINNGGSVRARAISINGRDSTSFYAGTGSAAFQRTNAHASGFAGSYSRNQIIGSVKAWIEAADVTTVNGGLSVVASHASSAKILAAAASIAKNSNTAFAGSFAFNKLTWTTEAFLDGVTANIDGNTSVFATNEANATTIAGGATWTGRAGVGVSFSRNNINYVTLAKLRGSNLVLSGVLLTNAAHDANFTSLAASFSTGQSATFVGTVAINKVGGNVVAATIDSQIEAQRVTSKSTDTSKIRAYSGGVAAFGQTVGLGFGGAYAGNHTNQLVITFAKSAQISALNDVVLTATSDIKYNATSLAGSQQNNFALGLSVSENRVDKNLKTYADSSTITTEDDIRLEAIESSDFGAYGVEFALANLAFGASMGINEANMDIESRATGSTLQSNAGKVSLNALDQTNINAVAVGGAFGQVASLGGSYSKNIIDTDVSTHLTNSFALAIDDVELNASSQNKIFALAGGLDGAAGFGFGAAIGINDVNSNISSYLQASAAGSATGDLNLTGNNNSEIKSVTVGGAGASTFALGGSVSTNKIDSSVDVHITDSLFATALSDIDLTAINNSQISSFAGGAAGAGVVAVGAAYSRNEITADLRACIDNSTVTSIEDSISLTTDNDAQIKAIAVGGAGAGAFALGGSITVNRINTSLCTCVVDNSVLSAPDDVVLIATDHSNIQALAGGAAGAGAAAVGFSVVDNDINRSMKSEVTDSEISSSSGSVRVVVGGRSTQTGYGIGAAGAATVSASGSSVNNDLNQDLKASINGDSDINAGRHVVVTANYDNSLVTRVVTLAGSGAFSAAVSVSTNRIDHTTEASIGTNTVVNAAGNVLVKSFDTTSVNAVAGQAAGSGAGAIGTSISNVQVHKDVNAFIEQRAEVYAAASIDKTISVYDGEHNTGNFATETIYGVGVQSTSRERISNTTIAVNGAGIAGAAGAISVDVVKPHVEAWIGRNAIVEAGSLSKRRTPDNDPKRTQTNINVSALSDSDINTVTGGLGFAISGIGISGAVDIGKVQHKVWGHIDAGAQVTAKDDIDVHGLSNKDIDSDTISLGGAFIGGISGSVSVWNIGSQLDSTYSYDGNSEDALIAAGLEVDQFISDQVLESQQLIADHLGETVDETTVYNDLHDTTPSDVKATVLNGAILDAGDDVDVRGREVLDIDTLAGGVSAGIIAGGRSVSVVNIDSDVEGTVFGNIHAGDDVLVQATLEEEAKSNSLSGQASILGWVGALATVHDSSSQTGSISNRAVITSADNVTVEATAQQNIDAKTGQAAIAGAAFGGSVAHIISTGVTEAYISNANIHGAGDKCILGQSNVTNVNVLTNVDQDFDAKATALNAGIVDGFSSVARVDAKQSIRTWIARNSNIHTRKDVKVNSDSNITATTDQLGVNPLSVVNMGSSASIAFVLPKIDTFVGQSHLCVGNNLSIQTDHSANAFADGQSVAISVIEAEGVKAVARAKPIVRTYLGGAETHVSRDAVVGSNVSQIAEANAKSFSIGLGIGSGTILSEADTSGSTTSFVGQDAVVDIGNNATIESVVSGNANSISKAPVIGLGGALIGAQSTAKASHDALALHTAVNSMNVGGDFTVRSASDRDAESNANGLGVAIIAAGGTSRSTAEANGRTQALVTGQIDSAEVVTVEATESNFTKADGKSTGGALIAGAGVESRTSAKPQVTSLVDSRVRANEIVLNASADMITRANGDAPNIGGINSGKTFVEANIAPQVEAKLSQSANVVTQGDITLTAEQSLTAPSGETMVTGSGGQFGFIGNTSLDLNAVANPTVRAHVESRAFVSGRDLTLDSSATNILTAKDSSLSIGLLVAGGKSESTVENGGTVLSRIDGTVRGIRNVTLNSYGEAYAKAESASGGGALLIGKSGAKVNSTVDPKISSIIDTNISATGGITMGAVSFGNSVADAKGTNVSGVFGRGNNEANSTVSPTVDSTITAKRQVTARGSLEMEARHNRNEDGTLNARRAFARAQAAQVAIGVSSSKVEATAISTPTVRSRVMENATVAAIDAMSIKAKSFSEARVDGDGTAFGLIAGAGKVMGIAKADGVTEASLRSVSTAYVGQGDLEIIADDRSDAHADGTGRAGGVVGGGGAVAMGAYSTPDVDAFAKGKKISAAGDFNMIAASSGDVTSEAEEKGRSILFNGGSVDARGIWQPSVLSQVGTDTRITVGNNLNVKAFGNHSVDGSADTDRNILVDAYSKGLAIVGGRSASSTLVVAPTVHAQIDGGSNLKARNDLVVQARSWNVADSDAFSQFIGAGSSHASSYIFVLMSTRAETIASADPIHLNAGGDLLFDSMSRLNADSFAEAKGLVKSAFAAVLVAQMNTYSFLSANTNAVAGDDIHLRAQTVLNVETEADAGLLGSNTEIENLSAADSWVNTFGATTSAGGSLIFTEIDP